MARLEGSYEQLGKRLGDLAADLQALRVEFRTEIRGDGDVSHDVRVDRWGIRHDPRADAV